jgi:hypothetical protein
MIAGVRLAALAAGLVFCVTFLPAPARAGCLIFCPANDEVRPFRARRAFERVLGQPLPDGVGVEGMIDGGFQDRFIQVKLKATDEGLSRLLGILKVDPASFGPMGDRQTTISPAMWWDIDTRTDLVGADATLDGFPYAFVARASPDANPIRPPDAPREWLIYILAFQT